VVAIFRVQGWRWDWAREVRELVFALDADTAGQQQWRAFAREAALPAAAYGGHTDVSAAWAVGVLAVGAGPAASAVRGAVLAMPQHLRELWAERLAIMVTNGSIPCEEAERLAWACIQSARDV